MILEHLKCKMVTIELNIFYLVCQIGQLGAQLHIFNFVLFNNFLQNFPNAYSINQNLRECQKKWKSVTCSKYCQKDSIFSTGTYAQNDVMK